MKEKNFPKISVVTPNYNQAGYLEATILSILQQEYPNLEFIIIDGGSTDGSIDIIKKYEQHLAYWTSERDNGQYHAVQKGFDKSTGEIMTYINSDDVFSNKCFFSVAQVFTDYPAVQWLSGVPSGIDEMGKVVKLRDYPRWNKYRYLCGDYQYIQQEGIFWTRTLWGKSGSYISTTYKFASDLELWSRFFEHADYYAISGILGSFRFRGQNQRSLDNLEDYAKEVETILANMPRTPEDEKMLRISGSFLFKLLRRRRFRKLFFLLGWQQIENKLFKYAPIIDYDRIKQKFIVLGGTEIARV